MIRSNLVPGNPNFEKAYNTNGAWWGAMEFCKVFVIAANGTVVSDYKPTRQSDGEKRTEEMRWPPTHSQAAVDPNIMCTEHTTLRPIPGNGTVHGVLPPKQKHKDGPWDEMKKVKVLQQMSLKKDAFDDALEKQKLWRKGDSTWWMVDLQETVEVKDVVIRGPIIGEAHKGM